MKKVVLLLLTLCFVPGLVGPACGGEVAVIKSSDADVYNESLVGFRQTIRHRVVAEYDIRGDFERGGKVLAKLRSTVTPNLLFTVGTPALQAASGKKSSLPVVYSMVFNPNSIIGTEPKNITGVSMNVSVKETFRLFKELSPNIRRVGVVFNPTKSGYLVIQAVAVARKQGIQLVTRQIRSANKAIQAVNSLRGKIDALWIVPNETILADEVFQYMLLFSYENRVPVLGLSERQTEMGALLSLSYKSSKDMGRQAGEMANRILRESKSVRIPPTTPRQVKLSVNLRAARKLKVEVPNNLLEKADNAVKAPVYNEGDWWVFQIKEEGKRPWNARVTYKDGKFDSDEPAFLRGEDIPDEPSFLAFASVYLNDPEKKWLDFPLVPGKEWSFQYRRSTFISGRPSMGHAYAEVIRPVAQPIKTQAGTFSAIKIRRSDMLQYQIQVDFTYLYSPETKSVIKLIADVIGGSGRHFEMELIKFGHQDPAVKAPVYNDGDWWVFRVKWDYQRRKAEYRVTYKNGKFESDDPEFLTGSEAPGRLTWLPLVSVNLNNPKKQWLDFPLVRGKIWSFQFTNTGHSGRDRLRKIDAEVIGPVTEPVETLAGKFNVSEIQATYTGRRGCSTSSISTVLKLKVWLNLPPK